jgi:hypothetical protein
MRRWLGIAAAAGVSAGLVWGCTTTATQPYPDEQSFCSAKAKAECQVAPACAVDASSCASLRTQSCLSQSAQYQASGTRKYNPDNAQGCIDAVNGAYGSGNTIKFDQLYGDGSIDDKCQRVFQGTADKNQPCTTDYDCSGSRICSPVSPGSQSKVCADKQSKNSGDFCADPGSVCTGDTYCSTSTGGAAQCVASPTAGQACSATVPCASAFRCQGSACQDRVGGSSACTTNGDCNSSFPYCDPYANSTCTIGLTFANGSFDCAAFKPGGLVDAGVDSGNGIDAATGTDAGGMDATGG